MFPNCAICVVVAAVVVVVVLAVVVVVVVVVVEKQPQLGSGKDSQSHMKMCVMYNNSIYLNMSELDF